MLTKIQRYFYRTRNRRKCKCGCGKHLCLENYWKHPTVYKKVPEFLRGHNHVGDRQTRDHISRRAVKIAQTWERKRETRKMVISDLTTESLPTQLSPQ